MYIVDDGRESGPREYERLEQVCQAVFLILEKGRLNDHYGKITIERRTECPERKTG